MAITLNGTTGITTPGLSADNPTLTVDSANNRVGIGTTNPTNKLHVTASDTNVAKFDGPANALVEFIGSGFVTAKIQCGAEAVFGSVNNFPTAFVTNNTEKVRITSSGNVGIGTNNPSTKLDVYGSIYARNGATIRTYRSDNSRYGSMYTNGNGTYVESTSNGDNMYVRSVYNNVYIVTGTTNHLSVTQTGNVGIGTTNPGKKLHVIDGNGGGIRIGRSSIDDNESSVIDFYYGSNLYYSASIEALKKTGGHSDIYFYNGTATIKNTNPTLTLINTGNVGIGTTNPQGKVEIKTGSSSGLIIDSEGGSIYHSKIVNSGGDLILGSRNTSADTSVVSNRNVYFKSGASETLGMTLKSDGNVGIGYTNPSDKLQVNGKAYFAGKIATQPILNNGSSTGYVQYPASGYGEFLQMIVPAGNYNSGSNANEYDLEGMPSSSSSDASIVTYLLTVKTAGTANDGGTKTWIVIVWGSSTSNFQATLLASKNVGVAPSISISRVDPGGGASHKIRVSGNNNARIQSLTAIKLN